MLTPEQNRLLTQVGPGTPMGEYLRRYWHPIAGVSELDSAPVRPVKLLGEELVLYKDLEGRYGLLERHCPHRRADLAYGMIEKNGLRCSYHGWRFDNGGNCTAQPYEDTVRGGNSGRGAVRQRAYPVEAKGGLIWAYLGPEPRPLLPDWEPFGWDNRFNQIAMAEVPCNWFQCQENSIDPLHFEWMHDNWSRRLNGDFDSVGPTHLKVRFEEFEHGFTYHRIRSDTDDKNEHWTVGRVFLWPHCFYLGEHFEFRVPMDDENTLSILWKSVRVPREREPYVQGSIPTWRAPVVDEKGAWITSHVMNQDFLAWVGQGRIADRTKERLVLSDGGIVMIRKRFFDDLEKVRAGADPKGLIRDPERNKAVPLPMHDHARMRTGWTIEEIRANPFLRMTATGFLLQAGQPAAVKAAFDKAMGMPA